MSIDDFEQYFDRTGCVDGCVCSDGLAVGVVEHPCIADTNAIMRADGHAAVEAGEAVGAVESDGAPLGVEAVDPVVAAEGVGDADGEVIFAAGVRGLGEVALEGELFHDGVADEFAVEVDLGAEVGSADVEEDAFALHGCGDVDGAVPPGDTEVCAVLWDGVVGGVAIFFGCVGAGAVGAPEVLLDRRGEEDFFSCLWREDVPASGGWVGGKSGEV